MPCLNGATCVDQVNSFVCQCQAGFTGSYCETGKLEVVYSKGFYFNSSLVLVMHLPSTEFNLGSFLNLSLLAAAGTLEAKIEGGGCQGYEGVEFTRL